MSTVPRKPGVKKTPVPKKVMSKRIHRRFAVSSERRVWLIQRLQASDGPVYSDLINELVTATPQPDESAFTTSVCCVRAVRGLLWDRMAVTENDETVWLTPRGWNPKFLADSMASVEHHSRAAKS